MKGFKVLALLLITLLISGAMISNPVNAKTSKTKELHVGNLFNDVQGTIVIKDLKKDTVYIYNKKRSKEQFTPESTFKVPNALIGLEERAVDDEYEVKRWDGVVREVENWNRDHTLASAMRHSAIWFYQDMARDIGTERMEINLNKINYGNNDISGGIDMFWLDSSLVISAQEQVAFFEKLVEEKLPFNKQNLKTVKRIMINEEYDDFTVHGKTGTRLSDLGLGWYVGYVETNKNTWVFATNIDGSGTTAKNITFETLKKLKIIKNSEF
ncbi:class D beta-lactamase [Bacillus sp. FSL K6-3431]|uniref:class D beta-lactamase n=1 Tax=Bacillus sp. FSL K6-3431 TaxID=2921500 RepID=UPI0030FAFD4A